MYIFYINLLHQRGEKLKLINLIKLMRPWQWYKNLVVFIPMVFAGQLFNFDLWPITFGGFIFLCVISSISYILNDIVDIKKDRAHPDKRKRPIASGQVSVRQALVFATIWGLILLCWSYFMPFYFSLAALALFLSTSIYTLYLKNVMIVDIHIIALNFIVRTLAGAVLVNAVPSVWLFMIIFLLAIFWATGKRKFELSRFKHGRVERTAYTTQFLESIASLSAAMLLIAYILYTSIAHQGKLMLTIPIATFMVFRYLYFIQTNNETVQKSERIFLDKQMLAALALWFILIVLQIYSE